MAETPAKTVFFAEDLTSVAEDASDDAQGSNERPSTTKASAKPLETKSTLTRPKSTRSVTKKSAHGRSASAQVPEAGSGGVNFYDGVNLGPNAKKNVSDRERMLKKEVQMLRLRCNERDSDIKKLKTTNKQLTTKVDSMESSKKRKANKLDTETKRRLTANQERIELQSRIKKIQQAVGARLKLLGIDLSDCANIGDALDASLAAINRLVAQLNEKEDFANELQSENQDLKRIIKEQKQTIESKSGQIRKHLALIKKQNKMIEDQKEEIARLQEHLAQMTNNRDTLLKELEALKTKYAKTVKENKATVKGMQEQIAQLENQVARLETDMANLQKRVEELEALTAKQKREITEKTSTIADLRATVKQQGHTIDKLNKTIAQQQAEIQRLLAIINKPKANKSVQTDISGPIDTQVAEHPKLLKEVAKLRSALGKATERIRLLEAENADLLRDIDELIRKAARFQYDTSNHKGELLNMVASPTKYVAATSATDRTVRLWRIDPSAEEKSKKCAPYSRSSIDGKVDAICWSSDGNLLAAGTGFLDGPEGYILVWNMQPENEGNVEAAFRSRATVRFGRVKCLVMSPTNTHIFAGDTTGSIWCFDLKKEQLTAKVLHHTDVIYGMQFSGNSTLWSVSHDRWLASFDITALRSGKAPNMSIMSSKESLRSLAMPSKKGKLSHKKSTRSVDTKGGKKRGKTSKAPSSFATQLQQLVESEEKSMEEVEGLGTVPAYAGKKLIQDDKYGYWGVAVSEKYVACANRKVRVFEILESGELKEVKSCRDSDLDHVKSLQSRGSMVMTARSSVPRVKIFDIRTGEEIYKFSAKKPMAAADFLFDNKNVVAMVQELIPDQIPKPPLMRLYQYKE